MSLHGVIGWTKSKCTRTSDFDFVANQLAALIRWHDFCGLKKKVALNQLNL